MCRVFTLLRNAALTCILLGLFVAQTSADDSEAADKDLLAVCTAHRGPDNVPAVRKALEAGANINVQDKRTGQTCLMAATLQGKSQIVKYLLQQEGIDVTIPEKDGYTPPHGAGYQGRRDVMRILKEVGGMDVINPVEHPDGFSPLHRACWGPSMRHTETVAYLLEIGEDVNRKGTGDKKKTCWEMTKNQHTKALLEKWGADGSHDEL